MITPETPKLHATDSFGLGAGEASCLLGFTAFYAASEGTLAHHNVRVIR